MARVPKAGPTAVATAPDPKPAPSKASGLPDDRELVRLAQTGDKEAFEELVPRHQHPVFAAAGRILRRREDVAAIPHQTLLQAYFSIKPSDQPPAFSTPPPKI